MKCQSLSYFFALSALLLAVSAQAHAPKEHMTEAQAPDCAAMKDMDHSKMDMKDMDHSKMDMKDMDHSKMDMKDPVMQAMMKKCMKAMHPDEEGTHENQAEKGDIEHDTHDEKVDKKKPAKHQHKKI